MYLPVPGFADCGPSGLGKDGEINAAIHRAIDQFGRAGQPERPWYEFSSGPIPVEKFLLIGGGAYFLYKILELYKRR